MFPLPRDPVAWFSGILRWHLASVTEMLGYISLLTRCVCVCVRVCVCVWHCASVGTVACRRVWLFLGCVI